jgi:hypothetical protein
MVWTPSLKSGRFKVEIPQPFKESTVEAHTIGVDLAKNLFQVHGVDRHGQLVLRKQLRRSEMAAFFAKLPPALIGMEACGGAHHWPLSSRKTFTLIQMYRMMKFLDCIGIDKNGRSSRAQN